MGLDNIAVSIKLPRVFEVSKRAFLVERVFWKVKNSFENDFQVKEEKPSSCFRWLVRCSFIFFFLSSFFYLKLFSLISSLFYLSFWAADETLDNEIWKGNIAFYGRQTSPRNAALVRCDFPDCDTSSKHFKDSLY